MADRWGKNDAPTGAADAAFLAAHGATAPTTTPAQADGGLEAQSVSPVAPGDLVSSKYRVERMLGVGGMGVVVAATHVQLGQKVAIKFMRPEVSNEPEAAARFLREARAAVQFQGEHVARVMDVATLDNGLPYMVMEYLRGTDLAELLRVRGALPVDDALDYLLQACEAIAEAHSLGIIHRDLKPANLFLTARPDGSPMLKVLDFGISKHSGLMEGLGIASLTTGHAIMGSPRYMSPEQMRSTKSVDGRTDIWALGCILYELLTARPTFDADTTPDLCAAIATKPPPSVRTTRPDVPPDIERVIFRCLEKDPARRMASIADLARALAPMAPKRAQVSVERIIRMSRQPSRPDHGIGYAATIASSPQPPLAGESATDQSFARSAGVTTVKSGSGGVVLVLSAMIGVVIGAAVFVYVRTTPRTPTAAASGTSSVPAASAIVSAVTSTSAPTEAPTATAWATSPRPDTTVATTPPPKPATAPPKRAPRPPRSTTNPGGAPVPPVDVNPNDNGLLDRK